MNNHQKKTIGWGAFVFVFLLLIVGESPEWFKGNLFVLVGIPLSILVIAVLEYYEDPIGRTNIPTTVVKCVFVGVIVLLVVLRIGEVGFP